jgi:hypothetical protein
MVFMILLNYFLSDVLCLVSIASMIDFAIFHPYFDSGEDVFLEGWVNGTRLIGIIEQFHC